MTSPHPINIIYTCTTPTPSSLNYILFSLNSQFPLRNLHWRSSTRPNLRTIQECDVKLWRLGEVLHPKEGKEWEVKGLRRLPREVEVGSLVQGGLINVCFVECEDSDQYKSSLKGLIQSWLSSLPSPAKSHAQNIIVLISSSTITSSVSGSGTSGHIPSESVSTKGGMGASSSGSGLFNLGKGGSAASNSILNKIKSDFETPSSSSQSTSSRPTSSSSVTSPIGTSSHSSTRVISLPLPNPLPAIQNKPVPDPTLFVDLIAGLKESILAGFDAIIKEREEGVRRGEGGMRGLGMGVGGEGWSWGRFFVVKECLAFTFEDMGLYEDALMVYDELEGVMVQVLRDGSTSIGKPGIETIASYSPLSLPSTQSTPALSSPETPSTSYDPSTQSTASTFTIYDYKLYIFRRQLQILRKSLDLGVKTLGGRSVGLDTVGRGMEWVRGMGKWLRENAGNNSGDAVEAWMFDAVRAVDRVCGEISDILYEGSGNTRDVLREKEEERTAFVAARGELVQLGVIQMDRVGVKNGLLPPKYPFLHSATLLPKKNDILFDIPPSPIVPEFADEEDAKAAADKAIQEGLRERELTRAVRKRETFLELYKKGLEQARVVGKGDERLRAKLSIDERSAALAYHEGDIQTARKAYLELCQCYLSLEAIQAGPIVPAWTEIRLRALSMAIECHDRLGIEPDRTFVMLCLEWMSVFCGAEGVDEESIPVKDTSRRILEALDRFNLIAQTQVFDIVDHSLFQVALAIKNAQPLDTEDGYSIEVDVNSRCPNTVEVDDIRICLAGKEMDQLWFTSRKQLVGPGRNRVTLSSPMPVSGTFRWVSTEIIKGHLYFGYPSSNDLASLRHRMIVIPEDKQAFSAELHVSREVSLDAAPRLELVMHTGRNDVNEALIVLVSEEPGIRFLYEQSTSAEGITFEAKAEGVILKDLQSGSSVALSIPYFADRHLDNMVARVNIDYKTKPQPELTRTLRKAVNVDLMLPLAVNVQDFFRPDCLISRFTVSAVCRDALTVTNVTLGEENKDFEVKPLAREQKSQVVLYDEPVSYIFRIFRKQQAAATRLLKLQLNYRLGQEVPERQRRLVIPVEIPVMQIISVSRFVFPAQETEYQISQAIPIQLQLESSRAWSDGQEEAQHTMLYDVVGDKDGWLVGGPKRGTYTADPSKPVTINLTLIPLRHGLLPYPSIVTHPIPPEIGLRPNEYLPPTYENYQEDAAGIIDVQPNLGDGTGVLHVVRDMRGGRDSWGIDREGRVASMRINA